MLPDNSTYHEICVPPATSLNLSSGFFLSTYHGPTSPRQPRFGDAPVNSAKRHGGASPCTMHATVVHVYFFSCPRNCTFPTPAKANVAGATQHFPTTATTGVVAAHDSTRANMTPSARKLGTWGMCHPRMYLGCHREPSAPRTCS